MGFMEGMDYTNNEDAGGDFHHHHYHHHHHHHHYLLDLMPFRLYIALYAKFGTN